MRPADGVREIMPDASNPVDGSPLEADEAVPFIKKFEQAIMSYAKAAEAGKSEQAQGLAMQAFMMAAQEAQQNPTPSLLLKQQAADCEEQGDWAGAGGGSSQGPRFGGNFRQVRSHRQSIHGFIENIAHSWTARRSMAGR
jgi:hypothetical protein